MVETRVFESGAGGLSADDLNFAGSTPHTRGKDFLTSRNTAWLPENLSFSLCGVSRRCPPMVTFAPNNRRSGLDTHH